MQCIARGVQGLPITELELVTIAFAGLNLFLYLLWWDKPLNVQCGVRVYKKRITDKPVDDGHISATAGFWVALGDAPSKLPAAIVHGPLNEECNRFEWPWLARVLGWPVIKPFEIITGGSDDRVGKRVYTFYPHEWDEDRTHIQQSLTMVITGIASGFGGIHCIGWSFTFPSSTERTLWRIASISITSIPIALTLSPVFFILLGPLGLLRLGRLLGLGRLGKLLSRFFDNHPGFALIPLFLGMWLPLLLYILSRLALLILPFLSLRSPPLAAYHTVQWTSFVPHI